MVSWRNWLAQESYTFKVVGSSPTETTRIRLHDGIGRHEGLWKIFLQKFKFNFHLMFAIFTCIKNLIK